MVGFEPRTTNYYSDQDYIVYENANKLETFVEIKSAGEVVRTAARNNHISMKAIIKKNIGLLLILMLISVQVVWSQSVADKTSILVLGTPHLSTVKNCLTSDSLEPLLNVLERYKPDVVAVEDVPSEVLEDMEKRGGFFNEIISAFDKTRFEIGKQMQKELNLSRTEAEAKAKLILKANSSLDDDKRLELIRLLLASFDYTSAVLHWSYLAKKENNVLPQNVVESLNQSGKSANEIYSVGVELARRLNLSKVVGIDDHYDEYLLNQMVDKFVSEIKDNPEYKAVTNSAFYKNSQKTLEAGCQDGNRMLKYYQFLNSPQYGKQDTYLQWGVWLRTKLHSKLDKSRIAQWEVRNLNIASNIRKASVFQPGKKILVIIGAGHKPFVDKYLGQMMDVRIEQFQSLK